MRIGARVLAVVAAAAACAHAATLERLSVEEMIEKSTAIVRGRAGQSRSTPAGTLIYTLTSFRVLEQWKGEPAGELEIALPGGEAGGLRQRFDGVPRLTPGREYVVFLWRGSSGRWQITGLSQGLLEVVREGEQPPRAVRRPSGNLLIEPETGGAAADPGLDISLAGLAELIRETLASGRRSGP